MGKLFKFIITYFKQEDNFTIGLNSFREKQKQIEKAPKAQIKTNGTLNFNLLHK